MRLSLIQKFTLASSLTLVLCISLFTIFNLRNLKALLFEDAVRDADKLSETIIRTTHYQMLENRRELVYKMIREVGTQKGIERIRLITKEGAIIFSTAPEEIGTFLDKSAAACNVCHASTTPITHASSMNRSRLFTTSSGKEVMGMAKAIYNQESCATAECHFHGRTTKILGVLDVILSLEEMNAQLAAYRTKAMVLTVVVLVVLGLFYSLFTRKLVHHPLRRMLAHTEQVAMGNLEARMPPMADDETGELASALNRMTRELGRAQRELKDWGNNLEQKVGERTRELQQMQARLVRSEKLASVGELVAGIAHEINNPLTGILVFSSLVGDDPRLDPALKGDMETISHETRRCADIVRGLLEFSRETPPRKKPINLNSTLDAALALVEHQSLFQNITVIRDYASDLPEIPADPNQLEQVFVNIFINAGQAMNSGGELRATTRESLEGGLLVTISDTGCGIPPEHLGRIFDPFFSTKETSGTGLGLSVSYGIINNHGGTIEVQSRVGEGTCFTINLPVDEERPGVAPDPRDRYGYDAQSPV